MAKKSVYGEKELKVYPTLEECQSTLIRNFRCPIDWDREEVGPAKSIFIRKWYYMVSDAMPEGELDMDILIEDYDVYLSEPNEEEVKSLSSDRLRYLCLESEDKKALFQDTYKAGLIKYTGLKAQSKIDRSKHYPIGCSTIDEVQERSSSNCDIGYIFPNFDPLTQLRFFWIAIDDAFEKIEEEYLDEGISKRDAFDRTWGGLLLSDNLIFSINTMTSVGYYNGKEVSWLIYDTSFHGKVTH